jgi:hypothetical protein
MVYLQVLSMLLAAAAEPDPAEVLQRAKALVLASEANRPNYTCVETVVRDYYKPLASTLPRACPVLLEARRNPTLDMQLNLVLTDRLRLDVAMTGEGEIYSWVGASKFEEGTIDHVVRSGPMGTGSFGGLLAEVFGEVDRQIRFTRTVQAEGRSLMEYSFQASKEQSGYRIKAATSWIRISYSGTFQVDATTGSVTRVHLETGELPAAAEACASSTSMELGSVRIGGGEFLLPTRSRQRFVSTTGEEAENTTTFSACREYLGESKVTFLPEGATAAWKETHAAAIPPPRIPPGLRFTLELTQPIDASEAAAGDSFTARLVSTLRDAEGKKLAPAHSAVRGRVIRSEMRHTGSGGAILVLRPTAIEIGGREVPLSAVRDFSHAGRSKVLLPFAWEGSAGLFELTTRHPRLAAHEEWVWVTTADK